MKKIYYILLFIASMTSGCVKYQLSTSDRNLIPGSYIFFDVDVVETKGNLVEGDRLPGAAFTDFGVFGFRPGGTHIFDMYDANVARVYRPATSTDANPEPFVYDELVLWAAGDHDFYGYYPYDSPKGTTGITNITIDADEPYLTYVQPTTVEAMVDVMTATETAAASGGEVIMTFNHRLFALDVILQNKQTESKQKITVKSATVYFSNVHTKATMYWGGTTETSTAATFGQNLITTPVEIAGPAGSTPVSYNLNGDNSFLLLPCTSLRTQMTLKIVNAWGEEKDIQIPYATYTTEGGFQAGHRYQFIISKTDIGVTFELASLPGWDVNPDIPIEFN